jgi:hypothetical protein
MTAGTNSKSGFLLVIANSQSSDCPDHVFSNQQSDGGFIKDLKLLLLVLAMM